MSQKENKILIKELKKFFTSVTSLMLVPKNAPHAPFSEMPTLFLIMNEQDFKNAKHYNINATIVSLLDDKYPVLHINLNETTLKAEYSLRDEESGLNFYLKTLDATQPLLDFLKLTDHTEKIPMILMGQKSDGTFIYDEDVKNNLMLIIDGYFIE